MGLKPEGLQRPFSLTILREKKCSQSKKFHAKLSALPWQSCLELKQPSHQQEDKKTVNQNDTVWHLQLQNKTRHLLNKNKHKIS